MSYLMATLIIPPYSIGKDLENMMKNPNTYITLSVHFKAQTLEDGLFMDDR